MAIDWKKFILRFTARLSSGLGRLIMTLWVIMAALLICTIWLAPIGLVMLVPVAAIEAIAWVARQSMATAEESRRLPPRHP